MEQDPIRNAERPVFRVVYSRPCWVYRKADLDRFTNLTVGVGSIPYIFQSQGKPLPSRSDATSTQAQIAVHMDSCTGELLAKVPLQPAYRKDGVITLPPVPFPRQRGQHDLCALRWRAPMLPRSGSSITFSRWALPNADEKGVIGTDL
jgi:hexosaminidase